MTLTYRSIKGARLTSAEFDGNTAEIQGCKDRLDAVEAGGGGDNPMVDLVATGSTLTKYFADGTTAVEVVSAISASPVATITGTTYTLTAGGAGKYFRCTNAAGCAITVPASGTLGAGANAEWHFRVGAGAGPLTFVEGSSGVTIEVPAGFAAGTDVEGATVTLKMWATDSFDLFGLLAAA